LYGPQTVGFEYMIWNGLGVLGNCTGSLSLYFRVARPEAQLYLAIKEYSTYKYGLRSTVE
jgi:hypothetical protein